MMNLLASLTFVSSLWMSFGSVVITGPKYGKAGPPPASSAMIPYCFPGVTGVRACPCSNPPFPVGGQEGCDNGATGGASLDASGTASILYDSLSFQVGNSLPTLHTLYVGTSTNPGGLVFGAGIRCAAGTVSLLATVTATGGPPSSVAFTSIYAKSTAAGVPPNVGQSYYYFVAYDNPVMSACNPNFAVNSTNGGIVVWGP